LVPGETVVIPVVGKATHAEVAGVLTVANVGPAGSRLVVDALTLDTSPQGAFRLSLHRGGDLPSDEVPWVLGSQEEAPSALPREVSAALVLARPRGLASAEATVTLHTNDEAHGRTAVSYHFLARWDLPALRVLPRVLDFGRVPPDGTELRRVTVENAGAALLVVDGFVLAGAPGFALVDDQGRWETSSATAAGVEFPNPIEVAPGDRYEFSVEFAPKTADPKEGELRLFSNDPMTGEAGARVELLGNTAGPCLSVEPGSVDFGGTVVGETATTTVTLRSCGALPVEIRGLRLLPQEAVDWATVSPAFALDLAEGPPGGGRTEAQVGGGGEPIATLESPGEEMAFHVRYRPDAVSGPGPGGSPSRDSGFVEVRSNATPETTLVDLQGFGVEKSCPSARITVQEGTEVIPQTNLHLSGTQSESTVGPITAWRWTVDQPAGSKSVFLPSAAAPTPTFEANVAGTYRFRLDVWDVTGQRSCVQADAEVVVVPDEAVHVELLWDTPGDPDPTDVSEPGGPDVGSDVDLHFLHPLASGAFDTTYDCFWFNDNPEWGSSDPSVDDDPRLDRDDTDGAGPENINVNALQPGMEYRVAVHYWDDHGFGPSLARVRVYVYGALVWESAAIPITYLDWCDVARISWPDGVVAPYASEGPPYACEPNVTWQ